MSLLVVEWTAMDGLFTVYGQHTSLPQPLSYWEAGGYNNHRFYKDQYDVAGLILIFPESDALEC